VKPERQIAFVPFRLDLENECVRCGAQAILLTPKAFAVLHYLVEHAGRLVTKEELFQVVWPRVVVSDAVLKVCVGEIRKALGDNAKTPRFIETLHRRGYRFIAPLTTAHQPVASSQHPVVSSQNSKPTFPPQSPTSRLVGREVELQQLHTLLVKVRRGERQVVFVTGEAGIGKTMVVEAFLERAAATGSLWIARGQCVEPYGVGEAYLPVLDALGRLCRAPEGERLISLLRQYAPTWLMQLPWLLSAADREGLQREFLGATRERMLRELVEALEVLTADSPLVLVLEDLQWSDYATLDLVSFLARRREPARLLVIGTYRSVDVIVDEHPLKAVKQELEVHRQCVELALEWLAEVDVAAYLSLRFPAHQFPAVLVQLVHQRTDGNPLFLVNVVDSLVARGLLVQTDEGWKLQVELEKVEVGIPESIRQTIEQQFERLNAEERRILGSASVVGVEFSAAAVAAAVAEEVAQIEERCEKLARRGQFLRPLGIEEWPDGTVAARYKFIHALYQNVLYQRVGAMQRLRLHQRIGEREEAAYGTRVGEVAAALAVHFEQGRDYGRAVQYLRRAAANAVRRFANREAIACLTRALELMEHLPAVERVPLHLAVLQERGRVRHAMGEAVEDFTALAAYAREQGQGGWEVKALFYLADEVSQVDLERCLAIAEQAVELSCHLKDEGLQAQARGYYGYWYAFLRGWRDEDAQAYATAVEAARRTGDRAVLGLHLGRYAYFQMIQSEYRAACRTVEEGLRLASEVGDASEYLQCQFFRALALLHLGQWGEMLRVLKGGLQMADKNGHYLWRVVFQIGMAWLHDEACDFTRARELSEYGLAQTREAQYGFGQVLSLIQLGVAHLGLEQYERAFSCFREVLPQEDNRPRLTEWVLRMRLHQGLSAYWLAQGEFARARQEAARLCELAAQPGERTYLALGRRTLAEIALAERKWAEAEKEVSQALAVLEGIEAPLAEWRVCATAAQFYEQRHRKTKACQYWARSAAIIGQLVKSLDGATELRQSLLTHPQVRAILHRARVSS
jgi:predicted ATPase